MPYYPLPDVPDKADPPWRRFVEQVRAVFGKLESYGQPIEVHQPFYTDSAYAQAGIPIPEVPVYRADRNVELLYATWTPVASNPLEHDLKLYQRQLGPSNQTLIQTISALSVTASDWIASTAKRFDNTAAGKELRSGELLTLEITDATGAPAVQTPIGLLSLYLRGAVR